jgi:hypothetical protein
VSTGKSGPRVAAFIRLLLADFRLSKRRASSLLSDLLNIPCKSRLDGEDLKRGQLCRHGTASRATRQLCQ